MSFPEDLGEDKEARADFMDEWWDIAENKQIAEGDISTSETLRGTIPELDDEETDDEVLGEDDLVIRDEDDDLGFTDMPDDDDGLGIGDDDDDPDEIYGISAQDVERRDNDPYYTTYSSFDDDDDVKH